MTIQHHPPSDLLLAFAAGSLDEPGSLMIATHATFCPRCRAEIADAEALGGALLEDLPPAPLGEGSLTAMLARLDAPVMPDTRPVRRDGLPAPLAAYLPKDRADLRWRWCAPGFKQIPILQTGAARVRLMRIAGGRAMPVHTHAAEEYTLVLEGGFSDENGDYAIGDFATADRDITHRPVADPEGCVSLTLCFAPVRLRSRVGRLFNAILTY